MAPRTTRRKRSGRMKRSSRVSTGRRTGRISRPGSNSGSSWKKVGVIIAAVAVGLAVAGFSAVKVKDILAADVMATIIYDQATANAQSITVSGELEDTLRSAADAHGSVRLIAIDGDGKVTSNEIFDMTPRLENGRTIKVEQRAAEATAKNIGLVAEMINDTDATSPGQAMFLGLTQLRIDTSRPVIVISSLLDVADPVDMSTLGWDVAPERVVSEITEAGELPDLAGAEITFIVRPVAGDQEQLRQPHVEYREQLFKSLMTASGANKVTFEYADGVAPRSTVASPVVPIPPPPTTPVPVVVPVVDPDADPDEVEPRVCVVDTSTYFAPDSDRLLNPDATEDALHGCVEQIGPNSKVDVVGHTAGVDPDSAFALDLSAKRAQVISKLLKDLQVPPENIQASGSGNRSQPYPDNPRDPRNRSVVVTITGN